MTLAETLNTTVSKAVTASGANFVPIYDVMGGRDVEKLKKVLPNPLDIHPNAQGYKLISGALVEALKKVVTPQPEPTTPDQIHQRLRIWKDIGRRFLYKH